MNHQLETIIQDFLGKVTEACNLLQTHLDTDEPHIYRSGTPQVGILGGVHKYFYHGIGCKVYLSENDVIDFDFGVNGRRDGFDLWRLQRFVEDRKNLYPSVSSENLKEWLQEAEESGEIAQLEKDIHGSLYFYNK